MNPVELTREGNRLLVRFPYSARDVDIIKGIGGGRWNKTKKVWTFGLSLDTCQALREAFEDRLVILPALAEWAWAERNRLATLEAIRDGETYLVPEFTRLPEYAPVLYERILGRPYQLSGVAFAVAGGNVLIGDQPGLGKTYEALGAIAESGAERILIACPRTAVRTVWEGHINELLPEDCGVYIAQGDRANREATIQAFDLNEYNDKVRILLINHEMIRVRRMYRCLVLDLKGQPEFKDPPGSKRGCNASGHEHKTVYYPEYPELFATPWDFIVMDESHKLLASTYNKQSKNITQGRLGAVRLPTAPAGRKLAVSATPNRSKATKAWGTLNWLQPDVFTSYWNWAEKYFRVSNGEWGGKTVSDRPTDVEQYRNGMRPYMIARTKAEAAPELPPIEYAGTLHPDNPEIRGVWLEMGPEQAQAYQQMLVDGSADLDGRKLTAVGLLAEITRRKQFASSLLYPDPDLGRWLPCTPSNKVDWILEFLEEREGFDGKVVIASQFTQLLYMLREVLVDNKYPNMVLTGDTSDKARLRFVQKFQDPDDPVRVGLINSKAGGESITLDQADDMILIDEPWTDDEIRQLEDRIHRVSRVHNVTVYRLRSLGTIEESIALLTNEQRELISQLRPEGRELARELLDER